MKSLYVRTAYPRLGLGRQLATAVLDAARVTGYRCMLPETLGSKLTARALYKDLYFQEIPSYHRNPIAGACYLKVHS